MKRPTSTLSHNKISHKKTRGIRWAVTLMVPMLSACQPSVNQSELDFAHHKARQLTGSPLGLLTLLENDYPAELAKINICVESPSKANPSANTLALETKLAYAKWIAAASPENAAENFNRLNFLVVPKCSQDNPSWHAIVKVGDYADATQPEIDRLVTHFGQENQLPSIQCQIGEERTCTSATTHGFGAPGTLTAHFYADAPQKWIRVTPAKPSQAVFSPHTDWLSISEELKANESLQSQRRQALLTGYEKLLSTTTHSFDNLINYTNQIEVARLKGVDDLGFKNTVESLDPLASPISLTYRPKIGLFHVLLHEIGHQFGLKHADNADLESVHGQVNNNGEIVYTEGPSPTKLATMAYGDSYMYLTKDDKAGAKSAKKLVEEYLKSKFE